MAQPLITIALSAYNIETYIADSMDCIINQTYKNLEIICIDDGSSDKTLQILKSYAQKDNRIKVVAKPNNEGLAVARNESLAMATGKYIIFLDGDDLFDLKMVEKAVQLAEKEQSDLVIWDYAIFYNEKDLEKNKQEPSPLNNINSKNKKALLKRPAFTWTKLINIEKAKQLNIHFPNGLTRQDIPVHWLLITAIDKIAILPERLSFYRQQAQATTAKTDKRLFDLATVMDITKDYLTKNGLYDTYKDVFLESRLNLLAGMYDKCDSVLKPQASKIITERLNDDEWAYIESNKPLRWASRKLFLAIKGNKIAKFELFLRNSIRKIYRVIKK